VKSRTVLVGGGHCLDVKTVGTALAVVARRAMEIAETSAVKATILYNLNNILGK
jgi:hypothetical protein